MKLDLKSGWGKDPVMLSLPRHKQNHSFNVTAQNSPTWPVLELPMEMLDFYIEIYSGVSCLHPVSGDVLQMVRKYVRNRGVFSVFDLYKKEWTKLEYSTHKTRLFALDIKDGRINTVPSILYWDNSMNRVGFVAHKHAKGYAFNQ